eukprot:IDg10415t1
MHFRVQNRGLTTVTASLIVDIHPRLGALHLAHTKLLAVLLLALAHVLLMLVAVVSISARALAELSVGYCDWFEGGTVYWCACSLGVNLRWRGQRGKAQTQRAVPEFVDIVVQNPPPDIPCSSSKRNLTLNEAYKVSFIPPDSIWAASTARIRHVRLLYAKLPRCCCFYTRARLHAMKWNAHCAPLQKWTALLAAASAIAALLALLAAALCMRASRKRDQAPAIVDTSSDAPHDVDVVADEQRNTG